LQAYHITDDIEIDKCEGCNQIVYDINNMIEEIKVKMRDYGIKAVPTIVIDGNIEVVGISNFPWICGDDLYKKLKNDYPLKRD
jgi:hypothetical protein